MQQSAGLLVLVLVLLLNHVRGTHTAAAESRRPGAGAAAFVSTTYPREQHALLLALASADAVAFQLMLAEPLPPVPLVPVQL